MITLFSHVTKPKVTLSMDGGSKITVATMMVTIANVPLIGPNLLVAPDASMDDGLLDISIYPDFTKSELTAYFGKVMNQGQVSDGAIQRYRTSKLKITSRPKLEVMADGMMLGRGSVKIKVLAGALRVIAPKPGAGVEKPQTQASMDLPAPVASAVVDASVAVNGKVTIPTT
ncbi:MAG: hypothetical protein IPO29_17980 [Anaerolineae bacterium]|nr:hypothetical protein [Anaerolineae bacterium]